MDGEEIMNESQAENAEKLMATESQERLLKYKLFVVKPEEVDELWNAEDPCAHCQDLLKEYISVLASEMKQHINYYSANEMRYEPNWELKWLADYIVNGMVVLKHDLQIDDNEALAEALQALWETLDFLNVRDSIQDGGKAVNSRFMILQQHLSQLYANQRINKKQATGILEYSRRTLFTHLQLFLTCCQKKQERRAKPVIIQTQTPQVASSFGLEEGCTEIVEEEEDVADAGPDGAQLDGASVEGEQRLDDGKEATPLEEEEDEIVDPEDPLYGLEQRLKYAKLDDATKNLIKSKLKDAQNKIKENLGTRQTNLDSKLGTGGKKK